MQNAAVFPEIERLAPGDLVPYSRNSRTHSEGQVAQIVASIEAFGFTNPILIDDADLDLEFDFALDGIDA